MKHVTILLDMKRILYMSFLVLIVVGCRDSKPDTISNAIYVWNERSSYSYFSTEELSFLKENNIQQIYCKLTDVSWDDVNHAYPNDTKELPGDDVLKTFLTIIPCVFIENSVMLKSTKPELEYMAKKIASRVKKYDSKIKSCQIDCDWSATSKDQYFYFLTQLKKQLDSISLTATLRLYQYKYPEKTGVPPVDRAMLMLYNFNSPVVYRAENSIFDEGEARKYITDAKYALPLDFALPAFSWSVVYNEENKFVGFLKTEELNEKTTYLKSVSDNTYEIIADTSIDPYYLRKGYKIKIESINQEDLKDAYGLIESFKNTDTYTVALFDLNAKLLNIQTKENNESLYESIFTK